MNNRWERFADWLRDSPRAQGFLAGVAVCIIAVLLAGQALAETVTVSWVHPTTYVDGQPLPASDLHSTEVRCDSFQPTGGTGGACPASAAMQRLMAPTASAVFDVGLVPPSGGTFIFDARTYVVSGAVSVWSLPGQKIYAPIQPSSPVLTAVTGTLAYELKLLGSGEVRLGRAVGTVQYDVACGPAWTDTHYQVPPEAVDFYRAAKSSIVVAACA